MSELKKEPTLKIGLESDNFIQQCVTTFYHKSGGFYQYKYAGALSVLAIATDRRVQMHLNFDTVLPNVWILLLGDSSSAGKSTTFNEYTNLLNRSNIGSAFSQVFSKEVLPQALEAESKRYIYQTEVAGLLAGIHRKNGHLAGLQDELAHLYDNPETYKKELTKATYSASDIFINCLWCTTPERFEETTEASDISGGLLARMLLIKTTGNGKIIPVTIAEEKTETGVQQLADRLLQIHHTIRLFRELRLHPSESALLKYNVWHEDFLNSARNSTERSLISRLRVYAFKLSMLYYVGSQAFLKDAKAKYKEASAGNLTFARPGEGPEAHSGQLIIPDKYFDLAMEHTRGYFFEMSSTALIEAVDYCSQNNLSKIIRLLERAPDQQLTRTQLMRKISGRLAARELDSLLDMLEEEGRVWTEFDNSLDGRGRQKSAQIIHNLEKEVNPRP